MELFDISLETKPKQPSPAQLRFLHVLAKGNLQIKSWPYPHPELRLDGETIPTFFHPATASSVVLHGWAEMKAFDGFRAVYKLSTAGREAIKALCVHPHAIPEQSAQILAGYLICKKCARRIPCKSKQPTKHPATDIHPRYGPICESCKRFLASKP